MEMSGQFDAPVALTPEKELRYTFHRKLSGPQSQSGCCREENKHLSILGIEPRFLRLSNVNSHDDEEIMNCKRSDRKRLWTNLWYHPRNLPRRTDINRDNQRFNSGPPNYDEGALATGLRPTVFI
jgi:hypothetical protein